MKRSPQQAAKTNATASSSITPEVFQLPALRSVDLSTLRYAVSFLQIAASTDFTERRISEQEVFVHIVLLFQNIHLPDEDVAEIHEA